MTKKLTSKSVLIIALAFIAGGIAWFSAQHYKAESKHIAQENKQYAVALNHLREEIKQLNQTSVNHQIHKNTRLDSASMNARDKVAIYELTLLDVSQADVRHISDGQKSKIKAVEKQNLIQKLKADVHTGPLFEHGWSMKFIQKTREGELLSAITITHDDMLQAPAGDRHNVI
ncbi:hypothetical protein MUU46_06270 [Scandinavium sp. TWS1a]|uniref:hypothetical protein n=1 Tax=Scandinavium tedordense TaxID=2926521 RepID=UPI002164FA23|nr:hypothetical protein [Scandinavium tedordense]MCS2169928.1 hypothetical protein [Scandinavium tedordense]